MDPVALSLWLVLLLGVAALSVAARRIHMPAPMLMLLAGVAVSFVPGVPAIALEPEAVFLLLLPPILYSSGVGMSWRGFRSNLRPILLLAVGCVAFTAIAVATVAHLVLGMPWTVGLVLGAVVAPPDAVAPMAIARRLGLPRRMITILEGESLVNDASALVLFSFAVAAVGGASLTVADAVLQFSAIVAGELVWGIAVGAAMLRLRHLANDPRAEVLLALATPFIAFWPPHFVHASGVVACVAAGLYVSWNGRSLIRPDTRLQGYFIWNLVTWVIEAVLFLLTGLQARAVVEALAGGDLTRALWAGAIVSLTVIVVRFIWVYPATYLPRLIPAIRRVDPMPNWRLPFMVAFTGLRGVVSLAAALSIPLTINGAPFPERDIVLAATFIVIAVTLLGLGSLLPSAIRWLGLARTGLAEAEAARQEERNVRIEAIEAALAALEREPPPGPAPVVEHLRRHHAERKAYLEPDNPADADSLRIELITAERAAVARAYTENRLTDEARRRIERELDLELARIRETLSSAGLGH
jgi:CPA1 family monovalent cation:H+ antiporter